jgi:hypothetical protein
MLNTISFWSITTILILYVLLLIVITILAPETIYIKEKPIGFLVETLAFPTFACIPLIFFAYYRNLSFRDTMIFLFSFWVKVLILHVLLEVSGFYEWLIQGLKPKDK